MEKGYTIEEADYKRNSYRPIRKEYWLEKGFSEYEAINKAKESKEANNKKGANKAANRKKEDFRNSSIRCIEYWLSYHMGDEEKAKASLHDVQSTFSLDICITKHGKEKGCEIWKERQDKWQQTLNSRPNEDIDNTNKNKSASLKGLLSRGFTIEESTEILRNNKSYRNIKEMADYIKNTERVRGLNIEELYNYVSDSQWAVIGVYDILDCSEFLTKYVPDYIQDISVKDSKSVMSRCRALGYTDEETIEFLFNRRKDIKVLTKDEFVEKYSKDEFFLYKGYKRLYNLFTEHQWFVLGVKTYEDCVKFLNDNFKIINDANVAGKIGWGTRIETPHGMLRSKFEYSFYKTLIENNITEFEVEKRYPNSRMMCDFYVDGIYIEIAPMYNFKGMDKYRLKMDKKKELFGSILITTTNKNEYQEIVRELFVKG